MTQEKNHVPNSDFVEELSKRPGGEGISKCVQCGICSASCMVANVTDRYRPRKLIQKIVIGKREEVLSSELPWLCMTCRMCEERCQEGVSIAEIFRAVRELAGEEGYVPDIFSDTVDIIAKDGWMLEDSYTDFQEDDRLDLDLDPDLGWNCKFSKKVKKRYIDGE